MSEFDAPRTRRNKQRVQNTQFVIGGIEHERRLRVNMNAQDAIHGIGDEWYEAREQLYDFYARYGKPTVAIEHDDTKGGQNG